MAGEGVISTGATDHHVKEGDAVVSLPHEGHTIESSAASPMRMAFLGFDRPEGDSSFAYLFEELDRLFRGEEGRAVSLPGQAQHLFHLFSVLEGGAPFSTMLAGYLIAELLIALIWRYTESREVHYFPRLTDTALLVYDMQNYVAEHIRTLRDLPSLARVYHYNYRYLGRVFSRVTGKSLRAYYAECRMREAERLLADGYSVTETAEALSYSSIHSFSRSYKAHYGKSPTERVKQKNPLFSHTREVTKMKLGVITDCLKQPVEEAIATAAKLGLAGVQIYATTGDFSPAVLSEEKIAAVRALLAEKGLCVSALCGDMGGYGFEREEDNPARIEATCRIIDLAVKFDCHVVTTHIGVIPADKSNPRYAVMLRALTACGKYAKAHGVTMAIETGPEMASTLLAFLEDTEGGVGVNLDPANFTMVTGQDAAAAVRLLGKYIVHTHAKDGRKLDSTMTPEEVYHAFAVGGVEALNACRGFVELPIGEGDVDWKGYIAALREVGYDGFLTIEREAGEQPLADITGAVRFLRAQLA